MSMCATFSQFFSVFYCYETMLHGTFDMFPYFGNISVGLFQGDSLRWMEMEYINCSVTQFGSSSMINLEKYAVMLCQYVYS